MSDDDAIFVSVQGADPDAVALCLEIFRTWGDGDYGFLATTPETLAKAVILMADTFRATVATFGLEPDHLTELFEMIQSRFTP